DSVFRLRCAEVERLAGRIPIIQRQSVKRKGSQHESRERWKDWLLGKSQDEACWRYRFLPDRCQFVHGQTNQQVEVSLVCGGRFDVISEERFLQFLRTTEGLEAVTLLFADPSIRPELIFTLLVEQGELEQVFDKDGNLVGYTPKA
ncbi:MAG: hypothetical protein JXA25_11905, partial [Anaerolineales bacterium]|nr:hypothetical protein [Anaerolineales bacterium]